jgi:DNA polymerase-3 subunit gamma/tau
LPTIRSRTQHFEFRLLSTDVIAEHLRWVAQDAELDVSPADLERVARRGHGSVRDALSVLDQVVAAGGLEPEADAADEVVEALCERDAGRALVAVAARSAAGHDARETTRDLLERLRHVFLATMARSLVGLPDDELARVEDQARRLGPAAIVRAMEALGDALVAMRDAPDPRVLLEVALVRQCRPDADVSSAALLERIERLERAQSDDAAAAGGQPGRGGSGRGGSGRGGSGGGGSDGGQSGGDRSGDGDRSPAAGPAPKGARPADGARAALGGVRTASRSTSTASPPAEQPAPEPEPEPGPPSAAVSVAAGLPSRDELTLAWGDTLLAALPQRPRVRFGAGHFVAVDGSAATFALPNSVHRDRCEECRPEVEHALAQHFGVPVPLRLIVAAPGTPPADDVAPPSPVELDEQIDLTDLRDAPDAGVASPLDQVMRVFEGAEVVED